MDSFTITALILSFIIGVGILEYVARVKRKTREERKSIIEQSQKSVFDTLELREQIKNARNQKKSNMKSEFTGEQKEEILLRSNFFDVLNGFYAQKNNLSDCSRVTAGPINLI